MVDVQFKFERFSGSASEEGRWKDNDRVGREAYLVSAVPKEIDQKKKNILTGYEIKLSFPELGEK